MGQLFLADLLLGKEIADCLFHKIITFDLGLFLETMVNKFMGLVLDDGMWFLLLSMSCGLSFEVRLVGLVLLGVVPGCSKLPQIVLELVIEPFDRRGVCIAKCDVFPIEVTLPLHLTAILKNG